MSSKAFTKQIFCWLHQINHDKRLQAIDLCVAVELTIYFNEKDHDGRAWPGTKTLAEAIGLDQSTVLRSVRRLHAAGYLHIVPGRRGSGHTHQYWMKLKPAEEQVSYPGEGQEKYAGEHISNMPGSIFPNEKKYAGRHTKYAGGHMNHLTIHSSSAENIEFSALGGGVDRLRDPNSHTPGGTPEGRPPEEKEEHTRRQEEPSSSEEPSSTALTCVSAEKKNGQANGAGAGGDAAACAEALARVLAIWRRGHPSDDVPKAIAVAKAAFAKVMGEAAAGDRVRVANQIVAGAERWFAAFAHKPHCLPPLPTFLATRAFERPPPQRPQRQSPSAPHQAKPDVPSKIIAYGRGR